MGGSLDKNDLKCGKFKDISRGCGTWDGSHKTDTRRTRNCQEGSRKEGARRRMVAMEVESQSGRDGGMREAESVWPGEFAYVIETKKMRSNI